MQFRGAKQQKGTVLGPHSIRMHSHRWHQKMYHRTVDNGKAEPNIRTAHRWRN